MNQESMVFSYVILPLLIFSARIIDQTIGILRIIFATRGLKLFSFIAGFFESLIWLLAIGQLITRLDNWVCLIAFPLGFATGNVAGIMLERKISLGFVMVRVIFQKDSDDSIKFLKKSGFRVTALDAEGNEGPVKIIFSVIKRKRLKMFIRILKKKNANAFYTIEDVRSVNSEYLLDKKRIFRRNTVRK